VREESEKEKKMKTGKGMFICGLVCLLIGTMRVVPAASALTRVFVSIAPQKYFVQKIGRDLVAVSVLVPAGADPHTYEPKPKQMTALSKSAVYFAVGVDFEKVWLKKIAAINPKMPIVHTDEGIEKRLMPDHTHRQEPRQSQNKDVHHQKGTPDPHIWLSPALVKHQADHILSGLIRVDPKNEKQYRKNQAVFLKELDALDGELKNWFADRKGEPFMVIHPSWGYFAQDFGLRQIPIEVEGKDPKPAQLQSLIHTAREQGIKVVFVQPQFSAKSAEMISREIGGKIVFVDPLAENWAENLRQTAKEFKATFRKE
jgi:zinc transport system substrate-binding protein